MVKTFCTLLWSVILVLMFRNVDSQDIVRKTYTTAFTNEAPVLDGHSSEPCWQLVEWTGDFIQSQPYENRDPSQETSFKILYDNDNLYVFIRAHDTHADSISRRISRRDNFDGDMVEINIDSYFDKQTAFSFTAMASGSKGDEAVSQNGNNWDVNWNPVWFLKTSIDAEGWSAEMKIPFSQLRFGKKENHVWGIQVMRHLFRLEEKSLWQNIPKGSPGIVHLYGELHGIANIKPKRQIEILPYVVGRLERFEKEDGNPFLKGKSSNLSGGLDGKIALTNNLTMDFSINPDFGQVEADASEVNLTAFESFFSERRPLFVEGKSIYQFSPSNTIVISNLGSDNLFYSRRIGRYPHHYPDASGNEYVKMPESTKILGALKLSGKTRNGLSIGILESVTANERAEIDSFGIRRKESVEPLTNYFVGRVQKDFNKGETVLGGIFTSVNRNIGNPDMNYLHTAAYTGGFDFKHSWKDRTWYLAGNVEFSNVSGKEEALLATQTSSARYYQRPDAKHLSVDSSLTSLSGLGSTLKFGKSSKKRIQFETSVTLRSPGLEFNDIGYMRYTDLIHHGTWVAYYLREPFSVFNNFYINTNYWMYWSFNGEMLSSFSNMNFNTQFKNRWRLNGNLTGINKNRNISLLRGGPSIKMPGGQEFNINLSTDNSKKIMLYAGTYQGFGNEACFRNKEYWSGFVVKPMNALAVSFEPVFSQFEKKLQYITTSSYNNDPRYLFARLNQKTVVFTLRVNYTISPEISVEYYGQPFVSAGKYSELKRIIDPEASGFSDRYAVFGDSEIHYDPLENQFNIDENTDGTSDYSVKNPNFNFREFRSNLVFRWEYLPGSTLFFVWSQGRTDSTKDDNFSYADDMNELFKSTPHNVFLVKFSYWFSL